MYITLKNCLKNPQKQSVVQIIHAVFFTLLQKDATYEEIQERSQKTASRTEVKTIYATAGFPTNPSAASQHHDKINSQILSAGDGLTYSTSNHNDQCPTYSTVNHPSQDPVNSLKNGQQAPSRFHVVPFWFISNSN